MFEAIEAGLKFASMPKMSLQTKQIAIPYHFLRSQIDELSIKVISIGTSNQFTKGLPTVTFQRNWIALMGCQCGRRVVISEGLSKCTNPHMHDVNTTYASLDVDLRGYLKREKTAFCLLSSPVNNSFEL